MGSELPDIEVFIPEDVIPATATITVDSWEFLGRSAAGNRVEELCTTAHDTVARRAELMTVRYRSIAHRFRRNPSVRRHSQVRHHVWEPVDVVRGRMDVAGDAPRRFGSLSIVGTGLDYDGTAREYRVEAMLRLPYSWPAIPVWITVQPWWRNRTVVSLRLRTSRRWRYPLRYFEAAHRGVDELVAAVGAYESTTSCGSEPRAARR